MFSKDQLKQLLELNKQYLATSNLEERNSIKQQLIDLVPESLKTEHSEIDKKIQAIHSDIKLEIDQLAESTKSADWTEYLQKLAEIQIKISDRASQLGVELESTDLKDIKRLIDHETGKN